jgi:hypothetical protein
MKAEALRLVALGPLTLERDVGWRAEGNDQVFNSHTVDWLLSKGWVVPNGERTVVSATSEGLDAATLPEFAKELEFAW